MANPKQLRRLFSHPTEAMEEGGCEQLLYVACSSYSPPGSSPRPDFLATVDVDPQSSSYGEVIHRLNMPHEGDEISNLGWNTCMSCYGEDENASHEMLVITSLKSSRVYVVNVASDPRSPVIQKVIEDDTIRERSGLTSPTTSHCLGFGQVMVSAYDKDETDNKGGFIVLDGENLDVKERWDSGDAANVFGHDFWYQLLTHNVLISSAGWGRRDIFDGNITLAEAIVYGTSSHTLHVWDFEKRTVVQTVDLGLGGAVPMSVRFLHDADRDEGFVSSACGDGIFRFYKTTENKWKATKVISTPHQKMEGNALTSLPAMTTDMVLSLNDRYLYCCNWLQGDVRQYDITDTQKPQLVSQLYLTRTSDKANEIISRSEVEVKGRKIPGGPSNITLSLDGKRLYVTMSLFSKWDAEIYPEMTKNGSTLVMIDVDTENGGLSLNQNFLVDFSSDSDSTAPACPVLAKQMRYPGGDCTSDIFLSLCSFTPKK
ncbi:methanethiol oxidase-like [Diadema antillarum]|uniref:methanethiol oxidase-like n=1 Tax=Diadema antillarum TaxID=105358 RepID=UPI003A896071